MSIMFHHLKTGDMNQEHREALQDSPPSFGCLASLQITHGAMSFGDWPTIVVEILNVSNKRWGLSLDS